MILDIFLKNHLELESAVYNIWKSWKGVFDFAKIKGVAAPKRQTRPWEWTSDLFH